jgi:hypothetical protein
LTGAAVLTALLVPAGAAPAATISVTHHGDANNDNSNPCALREAIRSANEDTRIGGCRRGQGGGVVDLIKVERGTHRLTIPGDDDFADAGDLDVTSPMRIQGAGGTFSVHAGGDSGILDRVIDVRSAGDLKLRNATIRGGRLDEILLDGAGIRVAAGGSLRMENSTITGNKGAMAGNTGGGIHAEGEVKLTRVAITKNVGNLVGGINLEETARLRKVTVRANTAPFGSGGVRAADDVRILDSLIVSNDVTPENTGTHGGGGLGVVTTGGDTVLLRNSTVSLNSSEQDGGGIAVFQGSFRAIHSTIVRNVADVDTLDANGDGGGIWVDTDGTADLRATVIANNRDDSPAAPIHRDCSGDADSFGFNLIRNQVGCALNPVTSDADVPEGSAPGLRSLGDYGGPTLTHALRPSSPLVDLIPRSKCNEGIGPDPPRVTRDQRGVRRPQGPRCDGGAFELE